MKKLTVLFLLTAICVSLLSSCSQNDQSESSFDVPENSVDYTLSVKTEGNISLDDVSVCIYDSEKKDGLIWAGSTDEEGNFSFKADASKNYIAVLSGFPAAYKAESEYSLTENTVIKLKTVFLEPNYKSDRYKLGSIVKDFEITDVNGNNYKVSELLKEKKAIILNFWFIGCGPCKMEFPYMQQAYDEYKDDIALLAINPYDGTNATVKNYANEMNLTMPMFSCGGEWATMFGIPAFPTTVVIDRYGMVAFSHTGMITDKETFIKLFSSFVSDSYVQKTYRNFSDIK